MTPSLSGRIQTRLLLVFTVGLFWTLIVTPILPRPEGAGNGDVLERTFAALVLVGIVGVLWELLYHGLQQYRWEKDWPTLFGLLTALPEGLVVWGLISSGSPIDVGEVAGWTFFWHFTTTWLVIWAVANGPIQILLLRWRYRGGRIF